MGNWRVNITEHGVGPGSALKPGEGCSCARGGGIVIPSQPGIANNHDKSFEINFMCQ
jgi:hypothetical protein